MAGMALVGERTSNCAIGLVAEVPAPILPEEVTYRLRAGAALFTVKPALLPAVKPPANVDVAVVEVAI